jgi:hypothetical protein
VPGLSIRRQCGQKNERPMGILQNAVAISLAIAYSIILTPFSDDGYQMADARYRMRTV